MLKIRLIPILTFNGVSLVKTKQFKNPRTIGNPIQTARVYNARKVDELAFIDIKATDEERKINLGIVKKVIDECFMPVSIGGGISSFDDISDLLKIGADKVIIKSVAIKNPDFIKSAVLYFGSQCISISVDVIKKKGGYFIYSKYSENLKLNHFIAIMNEMNVGEFIINSVDNDGMMCGYDYHLYTHIQSLTSKPLVALGGVSKPSDFISLVDCGFNGGLAAASIYHFTQYTPNDVKRELSLNDIPVRI